jgi:F0F1-type ATP synthase delta subunit
MASAARQLPPQIVSPSDLKRARRELEAVEDYMHQAGLRASALKDNGGSQQKLPQTSRTLEALIDETGLNLLRTGDRQKLIRFVDELSKHAPILHISFASEPSAAFLAKLLGWLRSNVHPQVLVSVGLQPSIAAGCVIRTANHQIDLSLAQAFEAARGQLVDSLRAETGVLPDEARKIEAETLRAAAEKAEKELAA